MSLVGHVDWYFHVTVCARETWGIATVAAPVAPAASMNLRRVAVWDERDLSVDMGEALPGRHDALRVVIGEENHRSWPPIPAGCHSLDGLLAFHKSRFAAGD